ncbi:MAG: hypothetical protein VYA97_07725, partial [Pseudomonadota bacterium]|nr:hypothetical protein [Pseudomonadota bacterium]
MSGIDEITLNFSPASLTLLNGILAVVMFSIAIDLKPSDFHQLRRAPKPLIVGLLSQFIVLPVLTFALVWLTAPRPSIALGLILVAWGMIYLRFVAPRLLPDRSSMASLLSDRSRMKFFTEAVIPPESNLIGREVTGVQLFKRPGVRLVDVIRGDISLR